MRAKPANAALKIVIVLALLGAAAFYVWTRFTADVIVETVERGTATDGVPGSVVVTADKGLQTLKVELGGRVESSEALDAGRSFKKGDVLLQLDTSEVKRAFTDAERVHRESKERFKIQNQADEQRQVEQRKLDETERLQKDGHVSLEDYKAAKRAFDQFVINQDLADFDRKRADEAFDRAKAENERTLEKMRVVAPSDGIIESVFVAPGALIGAGATVATFYSNERVVTAEVSEEEIAKVKLGDPATVKLLSYPKDFEAEVIKILPFANADTRRYQVQLKVQAPLEVLRPNATGEVAITVGKHDNAALVPRRAIFSGSYVYVVNGGRIEKRQLELGFKGFNKAEVLKGLAPGDVVVVEDLDRLRDGQHVRIARPAKG